MSKKTCTKCNTEKPLEDFYKRKKDLYKNECKECSKERARLWVANNRLRHNRYQNEYYHK